MNAPTGPAAPASGSDLPIASLEELSGDPEIAALLDFETVPMQPRVNGWDADAQRAFIALLAVTGSKGRAAAAIGRNPASLDRIFKREDGASFLAAHDRALALFKRNSATMLAQGVADATARRKPASPTRGKAQAAGEPGQVLNEHGEWEDEGSYRQRGEEAKDSIGSKLVHARRLYLQEIAAEPVKRAAFEILTELPIDWDKAEAMEPQEFEPWLPTNQRQPDMILTAESGWSFGEIGYGPNRKAELLRELNEWRVANGQEPVEWNADDIPSPLQGPKLSLPDLSR